MVLYKVPEGSKFMIVSKDPIIVPTAAPKGRRGITYIMGRADGMYCWCYDGPVRNYFSGLTEVTVIG